MTMCTDMGFRTHHCSSGRSTMCSANPKQQSPQSQEASILITLLFLVLSVISISLLPSAILPVIVLVSVILPIIILKKLLVLISL